jgi:hypothetical protein
MANEWKSQDFNQQGQPGSQICPPFPTFMSVYSSPASKPTSFKDNDYAVINPLNILCPLNQPVLSWFWGHQVHYRLSLISPSYVSNWLTPWGKNTWILSSLLCSVLQCLWPWITCEWLSSPGQPALSHPCIQRYVLMPCRRESIQQVRITQEVPVWLAEDLGLDSFQLQSSTPNSYLWDH